jgi:hypothetical protein
MSSDFPSILAANVNSGSSDAVVKQYASQATLLSLTDGSVSAGAYNADSTTNSSDDNNGKKSSKKGKTSYGFFALAFLAVIPGGLYFARSRNISKKAADKKNLFDIYDLNHHGEDQSKNAKDGDASSFGYVEAGDQDVVKPVVFNGPNAAHTASYHSSASSSSSEVTSALGDEVISTASSHGAFYRVSEAARGAVHAP